jgi:outer membrane protein assembly factor BamA
VDTVAPKRAKIEYEISTGKPYFLDTVQTTIATPCSLYKTIKSNSLVKSGNQYKTIDFEDEKNHHNPFQK